MFLRYQLSVFIKRAVINAPWRYTWRESPKRRESPVCRVSRNLDRYRKKLTSGFTCLRSSDVHLSTDTFLLFDDVPFETMVTIFHTFFLQLPTPPSVYFIVETLPYERNSFSRYNFLWWHFSVPQFFYAGVFLTLESFSQ